MFVIGSLFLLLFHSGPRKFRYRTMNAFENYYKGEVDCGEVEGDAPLRLNVEKVALLCWRQKRKKCTDSRCRVSTASTECREGTVSESKETLAEVYHLRMEEGK